MRVLILGGTTEAMQLARLLANKPGISALFSLAGRTSAPVTPPIPLRTGGFGGAGGLAAFLRDGDFTALVDATHPFAAAISHNAALACDRLGLPRCILTRAPWQSGLGDRWTEVDDLPGAARMVGPTPRRVFLTTGRLGIEAFASTPHFYLLRSIDPPEKTPPFSHKSLLARPPFTVEGEVALMLAEQIAVVVTKNSGAEATAAKLAAARNLGLEVVMVRRPAVPAGVRFGGAGEVMEWLARAGRSAVHATPPDRGV